MWDSVRRLPAGNIDVTSMVDVTKPLPCSQARKLIRPILDKGVVAWTKHAKDEMCNDDIIMNDVVNVLRGGHITEPAECVNGTWRYRVHTERFGVVIAFRSTTELVVVTAWRK